MEKPRDGRCCLNVEQLFLDQRFWCLLRSSDMNSLLALNVPSLIYLSENYAMRWSCKVDEPTLSAKHGIEITTDFCMVAYQVHDKRHLCGI